MLLRSEYRRAIALLAVAIEREKARELEARAFAVGAATERPRETKSLPTSPSSD